MHIIKFVVDQIVAVGKDREKVLKIIRWNNGTYLSYWVCWILDMGLV